MTIDANRIQTAFFGGLFFLLLLLVGRILQPFFTVILWSVLLYILFSPLYNLLVGKLDPAKRWHGAVRIGLAGTFSVLSVVVILVPLGFIGAEMVRQLIMLVRSGLDFLKSAAPDYRGYVDRIVALVHEYSFGSVDASADDIIKAAAGLLSGGADRVVSISTQLARNVGSFLLNIVFMVFTLFFIYADGAYLLRLVVKAVPIRTDYMSQLVAKFREITRNLVFGYILVAAVQALVAFVIFSLFGVDGALALAIILLFCSFIPMIGAGTVWLPLGLMRIVSGDLWGGIFFLAVCGVFISFLDNLLRPLFLKDRINLHPLVIFFSILGGVSVFGFNGLLLGPMIVILFLTVLDIFLTEHGINPER
jgi:predicted PurR-regulated permease PerM